MVARRGSGGHFPQRDVDCALTPEDLAADHSTEGNHPSFEAWYDGEGYAALKLLETLLRPLEFRDLGRAGVGLSRPRIRPRNFQSFLVWGVGMLPGSGSVGVGTSLRS